MTTELRVCIAAENASLRMGGEAILPFHYFRLLLERNIDVHLVVHERCREELLVLFPAHSDRLHFVADRTSQKLLFRIGKLLPRRVSEATFGLATQLLTQRAQVCALRALITPDCVIHQPIPVAPRFPSAIYGLGAPVVIGPLNGGMTYPPAFRDMEGALSRAMVMLGRAFSNLANKLLPGKREAAVVLVANERTRQALPSDLQGSVVPIPENAVDMALWSFSPTPAYERPLNRANPVFVFIGRLVDWKTLDVAIDALSTLNEAELHVVGDGPMRGRWQAYAEERGVADRVRFLGWQPQTACAHMLHTATALVLPSVYESGGAVVLEAMAAGCPAIATAWGGPTEYLDEHCGLLVQPTSREDLVRGFAQAMQKLASNPELNARMGEAGRQKVLAQYNWKVKIDQVLAMYRSALTQKNR